MAFIICNARQELDALGSTYQLPCTDVQIALLPAQYGLSKRARRRVVRCNTRSQGHRSAPLSTQWPRLSCCRLRRTYGHRVCWNGTLRESAFFSRAANCSLRSLRLRFESFGVEPHQRRLAGCGHRGHARRFYCDDGSRTTIKPSPSKLTT